MFVDQRLGNTPRYFFHPPKDPFMRVPDVIQKCVVFLGQRVVENGREFLRLGATGFIVAVPSAARANSEYLHLVTAKHVVEAFGKRPFETRINTKGDCLALPRI